jgi:membrane protease subunit (stomatin/prohibitin family)
MEELKVGGKMVYKGTEYKFSDQWKCPECEKQNMCPDHGHIYLTWYENQREATKE